MCIGSNHRRFSVFFSSEFSSISSACYAQLRVCAVCSSRVHREAPVNRLIPLVLAVFKLVSVVVVLISDVTAFVCAAGLCSVCVTGRGVGGRGRKVYGEGSVCMGLVFPDSVDYGSARELERLSRTGVFVVDVWVQRFGFVQVVVCWCAGKKGIDGKSGGGVEVMRRRSMDVCRLYIVGVWVFIYIYVELCLVVVQSR